MTDDPMTDDADAPEPDSGTTDSPAVLSNAAPSNSVPSNTAPSNAASSNAVPSKPRLNPAQQQVLDELGSTDRPTFRDDLRDHLREELEESLEPMAAELEDPPLIIAKRTLSMVHGCEARYLADKSTEFEWSIPIARGTVAHKAIELLVARRGNPTPLDLVDDAMSRLEFDDKSISPFLQSLTEAERADLLGQVNDLIANFMESFPPLERTWVPVAESRSRAEFCDDQLTLKGVVDLTLGRPRGNEAGRVLIDLKTGRPQQTHHHDLRFYALLETLKLGVPPRLLVSYYLDAGEPRSEAVTEDLLWSTAKRVVDGVAKVVELTAQGREPTKQPSGGCRFCPLLSSCDDGQAHLGTDRSDLPID